MLSQVYALKGPRCGTRSLHAMVAIVLATIAWSGSTHALSVVPPGSPNPDQPNIADIEDERLVEIYLSYREAINAAFSIEDEAERTETIRRILDTPFPDDDIEYTVQAARRALLQDEPDWNAYRVAIHATRFGKPGDARFVELARIVFEAPRSGKVSATESLAIMDTYRVLDNSNSLEAAGLLSEATTREFWGDAPFTSSVMGETPERCLTFLRANAIETLTKIPPEFSLPVLETLKAQYPEVTDYRAHADEYIFELGAGALVDHAIRRVQQRAGLESPTPVEPFAEEDAP